MSAVTAVTAWKPGDWNPFPDKAIALPEPAGLVEWLLQRREGIGASECAPILGMSTFDGDTAFSVWLDKTGQIPLDTGDNEAMFWGRELEPKILDVAARRLNVPLQHCAGLESIERPWQRASLDGVLAIDDMFIPIEAKNMSQYRATEWSNDQVPDGAELQVQHQLSVTGAPYGIVAGLIGGNRLVTRTVERDDVLIEHINREEEALWNHVLACTEPPIVARDSVTAIVGAAGTAANDVLRLSEADTVKAMSWATQYEEAREKEKAAAEEKAAARNNLVWMAHGHTVIEDADGTEIVRLQRGGFAPKRFETECPDDAALYLKKVEVIDAQAVRSELPDLYRRYQSVSIRVPK